MFLLGRRTLTSRAVRGSARRMLSTQAHVQSGTSLIPTTLAEMAADTGDSKGVEVTMDTLKKVGQARLTREEKKRRRRALDAIGVPDFESFLEQRNILPAGQPLTRGATTLLQLNVGLYCNQACTHCHVESSPKRTETMSTETVERVLKLLEASPSVQTVDITGGAPEMNAAFRPLVEGATRLGVEVIDRCNLTVLMEPGMEWVGGVLAEHRVRVVASLPCYSQKNVDTQRGSKVFERSIAGLQNLNALGYGRPGSGLKLDLVYNPGGAFLPPSQESLQAAYSKELHDSFGIVFDELFTMTNMPIKRFADLLHKQGKLNEYMQLLVDSFNPQTVESVMCRSLVSVSHDGSLHDCDFNLALALPLQGPTAGCGQGGGSPAASHVDVGRSTSVWDIDSLDELTGAAVHTSNHCFGCTAGMGSS
jgi:radical SAM/Cys-rich protein